MREILFRGKRMDNGEWVYGNLFVSDADGGTYILVGSRIVTIEWRVDPSTVGQYTGFMDKNNERIYEGDILNLACMGRSIVKFYAGLFGADDGGKLGVLPLANAPFGKEGVEIIGNIHDNPELLEGGNQ